MISHASSGSVTHTDVSEAQSAREIERREEESSVGRKAESTVLPTQQRSRVIRYISNIHVKF